MFEAARTAWTRSGSPFTPDLVAPGLAPNLFIIFTPALEGLERTKGGAQGGWSAECGERVQ